MKNPLKYGQINCTRPYNNIEIDYPDGSIADVGDGDAIEILRFVEPKMQTEAHRLLVCLDDDIYPTQESWHLVDKNGDKYPVSDYIGIFARLCH